MYCGLSLDGDGIPAPDTTHIVVAVVGIDVAAICEEIIHMFLDGIHRDELMLLIHLLHGCLDAERETAGEVLHREPCVPSGRHHIGFGGVILGKCLVEGIYPFPSILIVQG